MSARPLPPPKTPETPHAGADILARIVTASSVRRTGRRVSAVSCMLLLVVLGGALASRPALARGGVGRERGIPSFDTTEAFEHFNVWLWPFIESRTLSSGARRTMAFLVYHKTVLPTGETCSFHIGPYFQGPNYKFIFPIVYAAGDPDARYSGVVPFYFSGPTFKVSPPLLSGKWTHKDGSASTWITPLFHKTVNEDGSLRSMHALTYFQGPDWKVLFPFVYKVGEHLGVPPLYFEGPNYKVSPPLLSGKWTHKDGSASTWITPLYHKTVNRDGSLKSMHALTYFQGPDWKVFFPFVYKVGDHLGVPPFYFAGPNYKVAPPLLSGKWTHDDGSASTWITPLFHKRVNRDGSLRSMHALTYFQGPDWKIFFPFAYKVGEHVGVPPFYFQGPDYKVSPPLLSGKWTHSDGSASTWITPLFHKRVNRDGSLRSMHALTYFQGSDWKVFFPFVYKVGEHFGVPPLYFEGPDYKVSPPLLSGKWTHTDGSASTWITPLFHRRVNRDGSLRSMHALTYFQGPDWKVLFPFGYSAGSPGGKHRGIVPLVFWGPGYVVAPPLLPFYIKTPNADISPILLSGRWRHSDGSASTWITPLFHKTVNQDGSVKHMHALTYFQGPDWKVLFPFAYRVGEHLGVPPFYFEGPDYKVAPPLLSGKWTHSDGSASTWITPLFHKTVNRDGSLRSMHALTYFQGPDWKVLFPFAYKVGEHLGVPPFYFQGSNYKVVPPLLSGKWTHKDGSASTWITPLFHKTVNEDGSLRSMHALTYFQGPGWKVLFPFAYKVGEHLGVPPFYFEGPDYKVSPPLLSGKWTHSDGSASTWITPLYHKTVNRDGSLKSMHALTYFQGPDWKVLFPFAYKVGEHLGVPPFYFEGPDYKVSPPLLSGKWTHKDGSSSTWITPLFHKTVNEDGSLQSMHALTYFQGPDWKVLFPFAYKVGEHFGVPPLYFEGPGYKVVPPLLSGKWTHKDGSASTWITPLFHKTVNEDGSLKSMHALTYFQGPDWKVFFPFAYKVGEHFGVPPFYFEGPDYKVSPPLLSGKWTHSDGSASTWITPLFHKRVNRDGSLRSMHALAYFQGPDWKVFFPFVYKVGEHVGVPPFYFEGPDYKVSPPLLSGKWTHKDGSASTWITPLFHRTVDAEGVVKNMHALTYFQGPDWKVLFPFAYRVGEHLGVPPFYFEGPDYKVSPPLLSGKWTHKDGSSSTWITPLFHRTVNQNGTVRNMHALTYFQGPDWKVLFPFGYSVGSQGRKHGGIVPLVFWGPGYVIAPPLLPFYIRTPNADVSPILLSGRWKHSDGSASTWITPLFHKTVRRDGTVRNMHALTYFQGPDWKVLFPAYWQWKRADGGTRAIIPFLYWSATSGKGEVHRSVIPPLFWSRSGPTLDKSMSWQIRPFAWQRAGNDRELNILWRMFHYRREGAATRVMVGPLWRSERPAAGKPAAFQILGGLAARDCNYRTGSYRYRILWFIPVGRRRHFEP